MPRSPLFSVLALSSLYLMNLQADSPPEEICGTAPKPMRITTRHIEGNGIGYNKGYTTIEGFLAPYQYDRWIPFVDLRGHVLNDGQLAANAGLGVRYKSDARIWGINSYYDYRNSRHYHYNQVAMGLESLGTLWDFRLNGYLPIGAKTSHSFDWHSYALQGTNWILAGKREFVMKGASGEVGFHVDHFKKAPLYFAIGPYYIDGRGKNSFGGQLRAALDLAENIRLEGNTSYDSLFKWVGQGQVSLIIPFGYKRKVAKTKDTSCSKAIALEKRALQKVDRFEIIPVKNETRKTVAIDPATGKSWVIYSPSHSNNFLQSLNNAPEGAIFLLGGGTFDANADGLPLGGSNLPDGVGFSPSIITNEYGFILRSKQQLLGGNRSWSQRTQLGTMQTPAVSSEPSILRNSGNGHILTATNGNRIQNINLMGTGNSVGIGTHLGQGSKSTLIAGNRFFLGSISADITAIQGDFPDSVIRDNRIVNASIEGNVAGISTSGASIVGNQIYVSSQSGEAGGVNLTTYDGTELTSASNNTISITSGTDVYGIKATFTSAEASVDLADNAITIQKVTGEAKGIFIYIPEDFSSCVAKIGSTTDYPINITTIGETANAYGIYSIAEGNSSSITIKSVPMKSITTQSSANTNKACGIYSEGSGLDCTLIIQSADIQGVKAEYTSAYGLYISPSPGLALTIQDSAQIKTELGQTAYSIYIDKNANALKNLQIRNNKGVIAKSTSGDVYGICAPIWKNCTTSVGNKNDVNQIITLNSTSTDNPGKAYGIYLSFADNGDIDTRNKALIGGNTIIISAVDAAYGVYTDWENSEFCSVSVQGPTSSSNPPYYSCKAINDVSLVYGKGGSNNSMDVYIDTTYYKSSIQSTSGVTRGVYLQEVHDGRIILKTDLCYSNDSNRSEWPSSSVSNTASSTSTCCNILFPFKENAFLDLINQSSEPTAFSYYVDDYCFDVNTEFSGNLCKLIPDPCP